MKRIVRCGLLQLSNVKGPEASNQAIRKAMIDKHLRFIKSAAKKKVQILCLQEMFYGPYFAAEQNSRWYQLAEPVPNGPTISLMRKLAKQYHMVMVVPIYEREMAGVYYNTAAVINADGSYLGKYRKVHLPHCSPWQSNTCHSEALAKESRREKPIRKDSSLRSASFRMTEKHHPGFWEKFYFRPGNLGYPIFDTKYAKIGILICYDRNFPEAARILGIKGAEIVFNTNATVAGLSRHVWELTIPALAASNMYFMGAVNRVGKERPWNLGEFYGSSYFTDPRGQIITKASRTKDELLIADLDLDMIQKTRDDWQFYRDRRPETYSEILTP